MNYANFRRGQNSSGNGGRGQFFNGRGGQGNSNRGRGGKVREGNKIICQICGRIGHAVAGCYHRFDITFQGNQQSNGSNGSGSNGHNQQGSHEAYVN